MHANWIILISTLISTPNVLISKYQRVFDHYADHHLPDHIANMGTAVKHQRKFDHCAEHHLPDHDANMIQLSKL